MNNLEFSAIQTAYRAYEFRSRLEAKYAVFFDLCGWSWSYEPPEFNGWIPDFAIGQRPTLVEVKPFYRIEEFAAQKVKIIESGCRQDVILFGADPCWLSAEMPLHSHSTAPVIGWLLTPFGDGDWATHDLNFGITEGNDKPGLCTMDMAWVNQIWIPPEECSYANKWSRVSLSGEQSESQLVERWAKACNVSKWIPYDGQHRS